MLRTADLCRNVGCYIRLYSTGAKDSISLLRTKYPTDSWTNINPRFQPFIGSNLYKRVNSFKKTKHPLAATQHIITTHLNQWFKENVDNSTELKIYDNLDPVEPNTNADTQQNNTFYVNQKYKLRCDLLDREMHYLKDGQQNFGICTDLYRRCIMNDIHFSVFHRFNVIRTMPVDTIATDFNVNKHFEYEQKTLLETIVRQLFDDDVKFRWIEMNAMPYEPYWVLEIWHNEQWLQVCGAGILKRDIFQRHHIDGMVGWEIGIGLDRFVMAMFKIFDIRLLWSGDAEYLNQFVPKSMDNALTVTDAKTKMTVKTKPRIEPVIMQPKKIVAKPERTELHVAYLLPKNVDLEQFPTDELCELIKKHGNNLIEDVMPCNFALFPSRRL